MTGAVGQIPLQGHYMWTPHILLIFDWDHQEGNNKFQSNIVSPTTVALEK